jgi:hypothetical protein
VPVVAAVAVPGSFIIAACPSLLISSRSCRSLHNRDKQYRCRAEVIGGHFRVMLMTCANCAMFACCDRKLRDRDRNLTVSGRCVTDSGGNTPSGLWEDIIIDLTLRSGSRECTRCNCPSCYRSPVFGDGDTRCTCRLSITSLHNHL